MVALTRTARARRADAAGAIRLVRGRVRVDRRAGDLTSRLRAGEIAVLDEVDLDLLAARRLAECGVAGVVNAAPSLSGRVSVGGAGALLAAGIAVIDDVGPDLFGSLRDGDELVLDLDGGRLLGGRKAETVLGRGTVLTADAVERTRVTARSSMADRSAGLVRDAVELLAVEEQLLFDTDPDAVVPCAGRPVLLIGAGAQAGPDVALARAWCDAARPVVVVVSAALDVAVAAGLTPDVVVTDDPGLDSGARTLQLLVCPPDGDTDGRPPEDPGLLSAPVQRCVSGLPVEAAALALTQASGPTVVVTAGLPVQLSDYLDGARDVGAGLLLAGLRSPAACVPAASVAALLPPRRRRRGGAALVILAALVAALAILTVSDAGQVLLHRWFPGWHPWW